MIPNNVYINSTMLEYAYEEGGTLYLSCTHDGGPNNTYTWWINGRQLNETSSTLVHTITLADEDGGFYNCGVSNPAGQSSNGEYMYTLPTFFVRPVDTYSLVGGDAVFTCGARGFLHHLTPGLRRMVVFPILASHRLSKVVYPD